MVVVLVGCIPYPSPLSSKLFSETNICITFRSNRGSTPNQYLLPSGWCTQTMHHLLGWWWLLGVQCVSVSFLIVFTDTFVYHHWDAGGCGQSIHSLFPSEFVHKQIYVTPLGVVVNAGDQFHILLHVLPNCIHKQIYASPLERWWLWGSTPYPSISPSELCSQINSQTFTIL